MVYPQNKWKRALFVILVLLGGVFSLVSPARAQGIEITFEDSIAAGQVVANDIVLAGTRVNIDGSVEGDALAVGTVVEINGDITGSLVAVGQNVVINGTVEGTTYVAAVTLELGEEAELTRNLYFVGASVNSAEGSSVNRDLVLMSMGAQLGGEIGRNTTGIIGPWELFKLIMDMIGRPVFEPQTQAAHAQKVSLVDYQPATLAGFIPALDSFALTRLGGSGSGEGFLSPAADSPATIATQSGSTVDSERVLGWLRWGVEEFFTLLVFGLLGIWLFSSFLTRSAQKLEAKPLQSTGIGLLGLVLSIALVGVLVLVAVLILMLGIGLGSLGLWDLAWAVWGVGFTSLGLAFWFSLLFVSYGTKVIVAFMLGSLILGRFAPKSMQYKILPLLLGLVIYVLVAWIPYIGWVVAIVVNAIGLGAAWYAYRERNGEELPEEVPAEEKEKE